MTLEDEQAYFGAYEEGKQAANEAILNAAVELDRLALHGIISRSRAAEILSMRMDEFRDVLKGKPSDFQTLAEWKARYYTLKAQITSMGKVDIVEVRNVCPKCSSQMVPELIEKKSAVEAANAIGDILSDLYISPYDHNNFVKARQKVEEIIKGQRQDAAIEERQNCLKAILAIDKIRTRFDSAYHEGIYDAREAIENLYGEDEEAKQDESLETKLSECLKVLKKHHEWQNMYGDEYYDESTLCEETLKALSTATEKEVKNEKTNP